MNFVLVSTTFTKLLSFTNGRKRPSYKGLKSNNLSLLKETTGRWEHWKRTAEIIPTQDLISLAE